MKLSSALATLIVFQRHGHSIWASAEDLERKLLLNQADAAKRVDDVVKTAMESVSAGDAHGVALPLNYVVLSGSEGYEQQLTMALRLPGVERDQHVVIDTGSSSLAFCDGSLIDEAVSITKTDYAQCITYGATLSCPNDPSAYNTFSAGQIFQGNITAYNTNTGKNIASMDEVYFGISSKEQSFLCDGPLNGIIGVAYSALNDGVSVPSPDFNSLSLWSQYCEIDNKSVGTCNTADLATVTLPAPLEQTLKEDDESGYISAEAFGLYCDYAATIGSEYDTIVPSLGIFFGGNMALNNTFYNSGTPQVALGLPCRNKYEWYMLKLDSIRMPGLNMTQSGFSQCNECVKCYTDSGTSWISLPLPQSQCNDLMNTKVDTLKILGSMLLDIEGANSSTVTLSLPLLWLVEQMNLNRVRCSGASGDFILGFPLFQYYYLAFDMGSKTITFVDLQLSNEIEAFLGGTKLGGNKESSSGTIEPSSGYHVCSTNSLIAISFLQLVLQYIL
ncbi:hypothetical protein QTG54_011771 [Skeletonema marinoi]|uniref:Uncharacterized protein n=1 Tax=Skeletonema marinoi TaxID=267567 RepID=A0AAD8Y1T6_9STRA|nr:hypothetical protein QTG54_011771 [Skeletonema marinoi]